MKVSDLIEKLKQFDGDMNVLCACEDGGDLSVLDIGDISPVEVELLRGDDHAPAVKIGPSPFSKKHLFIDVTSDF